VYDDSNDMGCSIVPLSTYKFKYKLVWVFHLMQGVATANVINEFSLSVNISESYKRQCSVASAE